MLSKEDNLLYIFIQKKIIINIGKYIYNTINIKVP
jgi:hypothetical protein